jgi:hypothetical protein
VRALRTGLAGVVLLAGTVAACAGMSRVGALQPPSETSYLLKAAAPARFDLRREPRRQLGIGVDFYTYPGQDVAAAARQTVDYAKSLHANSISISFPFFMHGSRGSAVFATSETPSPSELAQVAALAEDAGMYVSFRPLLDEHSLGMSRTNWKPDHPSAWFASYQKFLLPYAEMAQEAEVPALIEGTEFSRFGHSAQWDRLAAALRRVYTGTLVYDNNWGMPLAGDGGSKVVEAVDSYQPIPLPASASVAQLTAAWAEYDASLPRGTVELEVGIAAVSGAYLRPYQVSGWHDKKLDAAVQAHWFAAACHAMAREHLGGVYFWAVNLGQSPRVRPTLADAFSWVDSPGATAVSRCFAALGHP